MSSGESFKEMTSENLQNHQAQYENDYSPNLPACRIQNCCNFARDPSGYCSTHTKQASEDTISESTSRNVDYSSNHHLNNSSVMASSNHNSDSDDELSNETRRERNRIAARKSRQRKVHRVQQLEEEKQRLEVRHEQLRMETMHLQRVLQSTMLVGQATLSESDIARLHRTRTQIIANVADAYTTGQLNTVLNHFHEDFVLYGPQSAAQLKGTQAILQDYDVTNYLYSDFQLSYENISRDTPGSKHYRARWKFQGTIKNAGTSTSPEFVQLVSEHIGKRIQFQGVSNISFFDDQIVYMHRSADQSMYLGLLLE